MSAKSWAKTNAWALIALPVLTLGVLGAVAMETDLHNIIRAEAPARPDIVVPAGDTYEIAGVTFGPLTFQTSDTVRDAVQPPNTTIALAALPVSGGATQLSCRNLSVIDESTQTLWRDSTREMRIDLPSDVDSRCSTAAEEAYTVAGFFAMPENATGPWAVTLTVEEFGDESSTIQVVRFDVE